MRARPGTDVLLGQARPVPYSFLWQGVEVLFCRNAPENTLPGLPTSCWPFSIARIATRVPRPSPKNWTETRLSAGPAGDPISLSSLLATACAVVRADVLSEPSTTARLRLCLFYAHAAPLSLILCCWTLRAQGRLYFVASAESCARARAFVAWLNRAASYLPSRRARLLFRLKFTWKFVRLWLKSKT